MKRRNTLSLGVAMREYMRAMGISQKIKEVKLIKQWDEIIGKQVANQTEKIFIKNKVLFIKIESSIIKQELLMLKSGIIKKYNDFAKETIIKDMVLY